MCVPTVDWLLRLCFTRAHEQRLLLINFFRGITRTTGSVPPLAYPNEQICETTLCKSHFTVISYHKDHWAISMTEHCPPRPVIPGRKSYYLWLPILLLFFPSLPMLVRSACKLGLLCVANSEILSLLSNLSDDYCACIGA